jgi:hypothetical protein
MVTKWIQNWCTGLILGAFDIIFQAGPVGMGLGPGLAARIFYFILRNIASGPEIGLPGRVLAGLL